MKTRIYRAIEPKITKLLLRLASSHRVGEALKVEDETYIFMSSHNHLHEAEANLSLYFKSNGYIIRVSNHWSKTMNDGPRYNAGPIRSNKGKSFTVLRNFCRPASYSNFKGFHVMVLGGLLEEQIDD